MFGSLMNTIWTDFARMIFNVKVEVDAANGYGPPSAFTGDSSSDGATVYAGAYAIGSGPLAAAAAAAGLKR